MMKSRLGSMRWVIVAALVVGCGEGREADDADAGADADSCPEQKPNDAGVFLTRRGCPITIEYSIR